MFSIIIDKMKFKILFETTVEVNTDDYDEGLLLAKAEADGISRVLMANTNYNKFRVKSVHADLSDQMRVLKETAEDMHEALKNMDK